MSALDVARQVLRKEGEAVLSLAETIGSEFERAVETVIAGKGRVIVTGVGKSGIIASKIAATLTSTGTPAFFIHPGDAAHGDIGVVEKGDVVIFVSKSGETAELTQLLPVLKRLGVTLISITAAKDSPIARASHCVLETGAVSEACPFDVVPTTSTTCALAVGDALAVALLRLKGFTRENFAFFHPGGLLGQMLNLKVEDVMHAGDELPRVGEGVSMKDAILEIMNKGLGVTTIVDAGGKLSGIVTDGDIKRILLKSRDIFTLKVGNVMSSKPRTIARDELVATAVKRMEENRPSPITCLIVVSSSGEPEGVVHLHDCLRARVTR
ncbi:MAG: KpsF/GutQ family sugar-phosphate isomerase [Candidatus Eisenbacteria bacterium]|nr:KpsF/GutQ family sugar-phosphate isomerase [Candidatus Eisenbacteria bacterium]